MLLKPMILLPQSEFEKLKALAEAAYPDEFCAILAGQDQDNATTVSCIWPAVNVHPERWHRYSIDPEELIAAQRRARAENLQIIGFAHSHPDAPALPSATDLDEALWMGSLYAILSVRDQDFAALEFFCLTGPSLQERAFVRKPFQVTPSELSSRSSCD